MGLAVCKLSASRGLSRFFACSRRSPAPAPGARVPSRAFRGSEVAEAGARGLAQVNGLVRGARRSSPRKAGAQWQ